MGGLRKLMPLTYWCFLVGALALVGIPPFAGFFSKDPILAAALARGTFGAILWVVGVVGDVPDRRSTRSACSSSSSGASRARTRASTIHRHRRQGRRRTRCSGRSSCSRVLVDRRRLDPVRAVLDAGLELPRGRRRRRSSTRAGRRSSCRASSPSLFGLVGIARRVGDLRRAPRRGAARARRCSALLEHKLWFDELYDARLLQARRLDSRARWYRWIERPLILGSRDRGRASDAAGRPRRRPPPDRPPPRVRARARRRPRRPRRRLHLGALT